MFVTANQNADVPPFLKFRVTERMFDERSAQLRFCYSEIQSPKQPGYKGNQTVEGNWMLIVSVEFAFIKV